MERHFPWQPQPLMLRITYVCKLKWLCFIVCKMAPTKRTSLTWKEKVVILDKPKLLKQGTSQRSAAEQLDIIGFGCFAQYSWHWEDELDPTGLIIQPLISAILVRSGVRDDITGFYCTLMQAHPIWGWSLDASPPNLSLRTHLSPELTNRPGPTPCCIRRTAVWPGFVRF